MKDSRNPCVLSVQICVLLTKISHFTLTLGQPCLKSLLCLKASKIRKFWGSSLTFQLYIESSNCFGFFLTHLASFSNFFYLKTSFQETFIVCILLVVWGILDIALSSLPHSLTEWVIGSLLRWTWAFPANPQLPCNSKKSICKYRYCRQFHHTS